MEYMAISKPLNTSVPKPNTETVNRKSNIRLLIKKKNFLVFLYFRNVQHKLHSRTKCFSKYIQVLIQKMYFLLFI